MPSNFADTYKDRQKTYVSAMGIGIGDEVYITHKASSRQSGWGSAWDNTVDSWIVNTDKVKYISFSNSRGLEVEDSNGYRALVPYFVVIPANMKTKTENYAVIEGVEYSLSPLATKFLLEKVV